jgi:hypothetical protein
MIALRTDCLLFQLTSGESVPCSPEMISVEVTGEAGSLLDPEMLRHAAASVFHYFKVELEREAVTVGEFSHALEKVLGHLGYDIHTGDPASGISEADHGRLAREAGGSLELFFFPRLRDELRIQLRQSPRVVHFHGLRGCVKQIAGARRWSGRCEQLQDQIVEFLRQCMDSEAEKPGCALVVE